MNWRGQPCTSIRIIIELIGATTTQTELRFTASYDPNPDATGHKVTATQRPTFPSNTTTGTATGITHSSQYETRLNSAASPYGHVGHEYVLNSDRPPCGDSDVAAQGRTVLG
jgi:hypothetical protein